MEDKPTIVFVPGAWHGPECFDSTREKLEKLGYPTRAVRNPSCGPEDLPIKHLEDDVANLRQELEQLSREGKQSVVIPHSYGGMITSCAVEGLDIASQRRNGVKGGVIAVGYLTAFAIPKGTTLRENDSPGRPSFVVVEGQKTRPLNPEHHFFADLPPSSQQKYIAQLSLTTATVFTAKSTYEPWKDIPCTYTFCTEDQAITIETQRKMVSMWGKKAGEVATLTLDCSHSPFLSVPDEVVRAVEMTVGVGLRGMSSRL